MPVEIVNILLLLLQAMSLLIIGRAGRWAVSKFVFNATEPVIGPLRQIIPSLGVIDITPIVALLLIQVLSQILRSAAG
jgi:YggT family protein